MKKFEDIPGKIKCNWHKQFPRTGICMWYGKDGLCGQEPGPVKCPTGGVEIADVSPQ